MSGDKRKNTVDIFEIDKKIKDKFDIEYASLPRLKTKLAKYQWILENSKDSIEKAQATKQFKTLNSQIEILESGIKEAKYIHQTEKILEEYTKLTLEPIKVDFMGNKIWNKNHIKIGLINDYINIAKNYITVHPIPFNKDLTCEDCKLPLQKEDDYLFVCDNCGYTVKHYTSSISFNENNRINATQRYVYDKRAHFGDSIKKFQGKQNTTITQKVYDDLKTKLQKHDINIKDFTKTHLLEFLRLTGHSDHYEDSSLIYSELTGISPPDISHLEQELFELFDKIDPIYERVKPIDRVNFLNGQFVLFKLLQKLKFPCKEEDFYILKTREKMLEHDQIWKKICNELCWTFIATV